MFKLRWMSGCTKPDELLVHKDFFRTVNAEGRIHENGFLLGSLGAIDHLCMTDPWKSIAPPDIMHTADNVHCVHLVRLVCLLLCEDTKDPDTINYLARDLGLKLSPRKERLTKLIE